VAETGTCTSEHGTRPSAVCAPAAPKRRAADLRPVERVERDASETSDVAVAPRRRCAVCNEEYQDHRANDLACPDRAARFTVKRRGPAKGRRRPPSHFGLPELTAHLGRRQVPEETRLRNERAIEQAAAQVRARIDARRGGSR